MAGDRVELFRSFGSTTNDPRVRVAFRNNFAGTMYEVRGPSGFFWTGMGGSGVQFDVVNSPVWLFLTNLTQAAFREMQSVVNGQTNWYDWQGNTNYFPPVPQATNAFSWQFGPEWAGTIVQVKATNGQTLGTWGLPANIGPGGYTLTSSIATNAALLTGAQVYFDGQLLSSIALASATNNPAGLGGYRPGYDIEFDSSYGGGEWQIRRSDGTIAMSGGIATLADAAAGRFTLTGTNTGTLWTRVPAGDGMGSAWIQSPVTFQGNNSVVSYSFVNNPAAPSPSPFPTPGPLTTPAPVPTTPTSSTSSTTTITNVPAADTNVVSVGVGTVTIGSLDDGETNVLTTVSDIRTLISNIVTDVRGTQQNLSDAVSVVNSLRLGGVSSQCTFSFGPHVSVSLQTSGILRAGLSALIVGLGIAAAVQMIRGVVS